MERVSVDNIALRCENLNRRLSNGRSIHVQGRNGYVGLDEYNAEVLVRTITVGSKKEVADFLHAMMVGIDLSRVEDSSS